MLYVVDYENEDYDCCEEYITKIKNYQNKPELEYLFSFLIAESFYRQNMFDKAIPFYLNSY